jgi:hypothetical protein
MDRIQVPEVDVTVVDKALELLAEHARLTAGTGSDRDE